MTRSIGRITGMALLLVAFLAGIAGSWVLCVVFAVLGVVLFVSTLATAHAAGGDGGSSSGFWGDFGGGGSDGGGSSCGGGGGGCGGGGGG